MRSNGAASTWNPGNSFFYTSSIKERVDQAPVPEGARLSCKAILVGMRSVVSLDWSEG